MRSSVCKAVAMICVTAVNAAQSVAPLSKHGTDVKYKAEMLLSGTVVSVFLMDGEEKDGSFLAARPTTLTLYDEATKAEVAIDYDSMRTIKSGTPKSRHRHVIFVVVVAAIAGVAIGSYIAGK